MPVTVYHSHDQRADEFDLQLGGFVAEAVEGEGDITAGVTAASDVAQRGACQLYDTLGEKCGALWERIAAQGYCLPASLGGVRHRCGTSSGSEGRADGVLHSAGLSHRRVGLSSSRTTAARGPANVRYVAVLGHDWLGLKGFTRSRPCNQALFIAP